MRVGSIGSYYAPNVKRNNTSFKADVRICRDEVASFGDKNELTLPELYKMNSLLKYAKDAYKNVGTDNDLIILQPYIKQDEFDHNKTKYDIQITATIKDTDAARRNILDFRSKMKNYFQDPKSRQRMQDVAERNPSTMDNLKIPFIFNFVLDASRETVTAPKNTVPTRADLDRSIDLVVGTLHSKLPDTESNFITVSKEPKPREKWDGQIPNGGW